jgi:hypothetical protein
MLLPGKIIRSIRLAIGSRLASLSGEMDSATALNRLQVMQLEPVARIEGDARVCDMEILPFPINQLTD